MSLSVRIAITLTIVLLVGALVGGFTYSKVFRAYFGDVERAEAFEAASRIKDVLAYEVEDLARDGARIAHHDALHDAIQSRKQVVELGEMLQEDVLLESGLDVIFVTDLSGTVYKSHLRHPDRPRGTKLRSFPRESINLPQLVGSALFTGDGGIDVETERGVLSQGILVTELGPLLFTARNLVPASRKARRTGVVLIGRFLGQRLDAELERDLGFGIDVWPVGSNEVPNELEEIQHDVTSSPAPVLRYVDGQTLEVLITVDDILRRPEFLVRATLHRDLAAAGAVAARSGVLMSLTLCLVLLFALMASLRVLVLRPLRGLTQAVVRTGMQEDYSTRIGGTREDEIGTLGREFDRMLERLEEARRQVIGTARSAGMSEIAQEILHTAGTVLNSVNISAGIVRERVQGIPLGDLSAMSDMLEQNRENLAAFLVDDPQGQHFQPFLSAVATQIQDDHSAVTQELDVLSDGIERVCALIKSQEDNAGEQRVLERVSCERILDDVIAVASTLADSGGIHFSVDVEEDLPMIVTDRHMVTEILIHFVQNAWDSIESFGTRAEGHRLALRTSLLMGGLVRFDVVDTGVGLEGDDHEHLFELGYTTREGGSGLGLHTAANTAKLLSGEIALSSAGPGEGATVSLTLPVHTKRVEPVDDFEAWRATATA